MYYKKIIAIVSFTLFVFSSVGAQVRVVPLSELKPKTKHVKATELITHILTTDNYSKAKLDDRLSSLIFDHYLEALDRNRSYFLQQDIEEFEKYRFTIDDTLAYSELEPAFEIFKRYRVRVNERVRYALNIVNKNHFSFDVDESYRFDRREDNWAKNKTELDEIWRKRIKNDTLNLVLTKKTPKEIKEILTNRYQGIYTSTFQLNSNDVFQFFINAYTTSVEPHTAYFSPRTSENFDISMRLSLEGIGAMLRSENDYTQIVKIITGGPADLSSALHMGDRITGIGQGENGKVIDVIGWRLDDVVDLIRGEKGTTIRLEVLPKEVGTQGPTKMITLVRDKIRLEEQDASSEIITIPDLEIKIGVIDLPTFYIDFLAQAKGDKDYKSTSQDVKNLIKEMLNKRIDGLIVDLRGNGGGSLSEALELTGLFIDKGPIVQTKDVTGKININYDPEPGVVYAGPLSVLVDRNSASASEIFAGAIQDYQRGIIVGEPTFGKGTVQNIIDLNRFIQDSNEDYGRLKTTIAQFFRVSGGSTQYKGVIPDIIFPTANDSEEFGERAYDNAIPWAKVKPANYYPASAPVDKFQLVRKKHEERIEKNDLFRLLSDNLEVRKKENEKKEVSLLESKRKKERERLTAAKNELKNAIRAEKKLPPLKDEELEKKENSDDENDESVDILLNETANILNDLIAPSAQTIDTRTVDMKKKYLF